MYMWIDSTSFVILIDLFYKIFIVSEFLRSSLHDVTCERIVSNMMFVSFTDLCYWDTLGEPIDGGRLLISRNFTDPP